jgi:hypothetical protein
MNVMNPASDTSALLIPVFSAEVKAGDEAGELV